MIIFLFIIIINNIIKAAAAIVAIRLKVIDFIIIKRFNFI
jgi:hypothetical protein